MDLNDKVVIVTGASSGIGKACAEVFGRAGAKVVLAARNMEKLREVSTSLDQEGIENLVVQTDVSEETDCKNLIEQSVEKFGQIDVLINNAGMSMRATFEQVELDVIKKLMDINFYGMVYCTKFALPHIIKAKGTIVGVSSIAGYRGLPGRTGYSSSKFAMQGFLESLRSEIFNKGVNVMWIAPGYTESNIRNTALNNTGKAQSESPLEESNLMTSEEVAKHLLNGVKKRKRTVVLTNLGKLTVFLNKWIPGLMDKMTYNKIKKEKDSPF